MGGTALGSYYTHSSLLVSQEISNKTEVKWEDHSHFPWRQLRASPPKRWPGSTRGFGSLIRTAMSLCVWRSSLLYPSSRRIPWSREWSLCLTPTTVASWTSLSLLGALPCLPPRMLTGRRNSNSYSVFMTQTEMDL